MNNVINIENATKDELIDLALDKYNIAMNKGACLYTAQQTFKNDLLIITGKIEGKFICDNTIVNNIARW